MISNKVKKGLTKKFSIGEDYFFTVSILFLFILVFFPDFKLYYDWQDSDEFLFVALYGLFRGFYTKEVSPFFTGLDYISLVIVSHLNLFALLEIITVSDLSNLFYKITLLNILLSFISLIIILVMSKKVNKYVFGNMSMAYAVSLFIYCIAMGIYFKGFTEASWAEFYTTTLFLAPFVMFLPKLIYSFIKNGKKN